MKKSYCNARLTLTSLSDSRGLLFSDKLLPSSALSVCLETTNPGGVTRGGKNPVVVGAPVVVMPLSAAGIDSTSVDLESVFPDSAESSDAAATLDCFDAEFRRGFPAAAAATAHDCCCCFLWKLLLLTVAVSPPGTAPTTTGSLTELGNKKIRGI